MILQSGTPLGPIVTSGVAERGRRGGVVLEGGGVECRRRGGGLLGLLLLIGVPALLTLAFPVTLIPLESHSVTVRDQILPRSPDRTPSVISDFPHGTSQHVLVLTWARHSFLLLSYLIFFIILIRTPLRHQLRFPLFPFRTSLCFLYVHVVYPSPMVTIDSIRTLLPFSISSYPTCTVAS